MPSHVEASPKGQAAVNQDVLRIFLSPTASSLVTWDFFPTPPNPWLGNLGDTIVLEGQWEDRVGQWAVLLLATYFGPLT